MHKIKNITTEIDNLILIYAKYDKTTKQYDLDFHDLPEHEQENLASLIMVHEPDYGCESLGIDNPEFDRYMMPSLIELLKNSIDKDNQIDFINAWKKGIVKYFAGYLNQLIHDRLCFRIVEDEE